MGNNTIWKCKCLTPHPLHAFSSFISFSFFFFLVQKQLFTPWAFWTPLSPPNCLYCWCWTSTVICMDRSAPIVSRIQGVLAVGLGVGQGSPHKRMQEQSGEGMLVEGTSEGERCFFRCLPGLRFHLPFCKTEHKCKTFSQMFLTGNNRILNGSALNTGLYYLLTCRKSEGQWYK